MRFRAEQHLSRPGDIRAVREQGQRLDCRAFTIWWKRRAPVDSSVPAPTVQTRPDGPRVCVIASTAAVGVAVRRNRAKRRLREVFRQHQTAVPGDCDLLLIARSSAVECPMPEMQQRFSDACRRIESQCR